MTSLIKFTTRFDWRDDKKSLVLLLCRPWGAPRWLNNMTAASWAKRYEVAKRKHYPDVWKLMEHKGCAKPFVLIRIPYIFVGPKGWRKPGQRFIRSERERERVLFNNASGGPNVGTYMAADVAEKASMPLYLQGRSRQCTGLVRPFFTYCKLYKKIILDLLVTCNRMDYSQLLPKTTPPYK